MSRFLKSWYTAGWSLEAGDAVFRRRPLENPVLFFRKRDGNVAAPVDCCPHRFAPLSMGTRARRMLEKPIAERDASLG